MCRRGGGSSRTNGQVHGLLGADRSVRLALGRVRGQHVRHLVRAGRLRADRDPGARRRPGAGLGARGGGAGGRCGGRPYRSARGWSSRRKRRGDGGDGPRRFAAVISIPVGLRARPPELRPAAGRLGRRRRGRHRVQGRRRRLPEGAGRARRPARRQRPLEATTWTATAARPAARRRRDRRLRPGRDRAANAVSYLLSALGLRGDRRARAAPGRAPRAARCAPASCSTAGASSSPTRRCGALFLNTVLVAGLILATAPLLAVLMLGELGFAPWQYGLAFGAPCVGGLLGARLSPDGSSRASGRHAVLRGAGDPACVLVARAGLRRPRRRRARARARRPVRRSSPAWACSTRSSPPSGSPAPRPAASPARSPPGRSPAALTVATLTALWGLLAAAVGPRPAIAAAGLLLLPPRCCSRAAD